MDVLLNLVLGHIFYHLKESTAFSSLDLYLSGLSFGTQKWEPGFILNMNL